MNGTDPSPGVKTRSALTVGIMALLAWVPFFLSSPGDISADTKAYLYLDPGRLMSRAGWLWDTHIDAGTITHQNIGYLFPLGPFYWLFHTLGVPTWITERIWFGAILFAAGTGTIWMLRRLGMRGSGAVVAGFTYMLSPYLLAYMGRTSVILLPWAALPWLIGLVHAAIKERTWRAPVLAAIVVTLMAGTNASSVIFVLIGPALLVPFMIWVTRETSWRPAVAAILRIAVTTGPAQLWWIAGLWAQGKYGLPILQLTESVETVAQTSTSSELLRGLGYWYFYGRDGLSQWTDSGTLYTQNLGMLLIGWVLPGLSLIGAFLTRWRYRAYFVALVLVGLVLGIGAHPYADPSPLGSVIKATTESEIGFALRNSPRAVPLLVLGLAGLLACLTDAAMAALRSRARRDSTRRAIAAIPFALVAVAILGLPPLWTAQLVQPDMKFPETLPTAWTDATNAINANGSDGRVLEIPGSDFYAYRWGQTQDPITPGLTDTPWVGRELTAFGAPATVDVLRALDRRIQEGVFDPSAVAPIARIFSATSVLLRLDTQYERYHGPRPADLWNTFSVSSPGDGLTLAQTFGDTTVAQTDPRQPTLDEQEIARKGGSATPQLALFDVAGTPDIMRVASAQHPTVLWGDGDGVVDAAESGLLPEQGHALLYAATVMTHPLLADSVPGSNPSLVVTDSNRRRAQRWGTLRENNGATEVAGSVPLVDDPKDARLDLFPGSDDSLFTVADFGPDVANVRASSYGNIVAYSSEARPANAIDGDPRTAWTTGGYSDVIGDRLQVDYRHSVTADHIDVLQPQGNRYITKLSVVLDGRTVTTVDTTDASFVGTGQRIDLGGMHTFSTLAIRIDGANVSGLPNYVGISNVGIKELTVPGVTASEWIVVPSNGLDSLTGATTPLTYVLSRLRANPIEGFRQDPELQIQRILTTPLRDSYSLTGTARLSAGVDGARVDELVGRPGLAQGFPIVTGADWLDGSLPDRPSSALDGDPTTAWVTSFGPQTGRGFTVVMPSPTVLDHLDLTLVNDSRHSVPTELDLTGDDGIAHRVSVPAVADDPTPGHTTTVSIPFTAMTTKNLTLTIAAQRDVLTKEYFSTSMHALPIAIAELGLPQIVGPVPAAMPTTCRSGLLALDGLDVPVTLGGTTAQALSGGALQVEPCSALAPLAAGTHTVASKAGLDTGVDMDRVMLSSSAAMAVPGLGGRPVSTGNPAAANGTVSAPAADPVPRITTTPTGELSYRVEVTGATQPFWLVLGQSLSPGWSATVKGGASLGPPTLIDGIANGWLIDPAKTGTDFTVNVSWGPQRIIWVAVGISAVWFLGLCAAAFVLVRRRKRRAERDEPAAPSLVTTAGLRFTTPTAVKITSIIGAGLVGAALGGTAVALVVTVATALAVLIRRARMALLATTVLSLGLITAISVAYQYRKRFVTGVEWPTAFPWIHQLGIIAVVAVVIDTALRFVNRRYLAANPGSAPDATEPGLTESS